MKSGRTFFGLIFFLVVACPTLAQEVGKIMSIVGTAEVLRKEQWHSISLHETLQPGDVVRTGPGSRLAVLLADGSQIKVNANSRLVLKQVASPTRRVAMRLMQSLLRLFSGEIWVRSLGEPLEIETLAATATLRGTELNLAVEPVEAARLTVVEGVVEFRNPQGSVLVAAKEQAIAKPGEAPRKMVIINPRDAVQWALYYPPLIDYRQVIYPEGPDAQAIRRALEHYRRGALPETLRSLEQVPPERRDARFFTLRAGLLLSVSQVAEARADIEEALRRNPSEATAHALRSIIALVQNQKKEALRLARQAVELEPQSPVPQVALSYAYQTTFDLEKALKSLEQAAKLASEDALIQARLAELELSRGELERALKAAQKAVALDPELARTQTVLGFAYLTQIRTVQAKAAFERAITLDSADPLPRLGLGLAKIRESHLPEGAREIEIAASLDPSNALIRSYLGKAYYEEKREGLAAREFAIAKDLDPQDPTPWFYDAIHKQSVNRPVEALRDLQRSIELNDNRAVYRSRFLLDEDLAARGAALGRIYKELGFEQSALVEGWKSLSNDPSDHSAHRLLSDTYTALPRHEVARVSELLQSQLLQSTNITPVQPQLAESDLFLLGGLGPSDPSLNEFNPLLFRNRLSLLASGLAASQGTYGDEVVQSGIWGGLSYSLGQFHYESDGFRPNNDLDTNIYTAYAQYALNPLFSVQVELRKQDTEAGDLREFSNPDFQFENLRQSFDRDTARVGLRWSLDPTSYLLGSFAYRELDRDTDDRVFSSFSDILTELDLQPLAPLFPEGINSVIETTNEVDNKTFELQYSKQWKQANVIVGIGYTDQDRPKATRRRDSLTSPRRPTLQQDLEDVGLPPDFANEIVTTIDLLGTSTIDEEESQESHLISYLYSNIRPLRNLDVTIGASIHAIDRDSDQSDELDVSNIFINPKIGVMWEPFGATTIRAAWLRTVKRPFASGQTVEPTQVAGFNQLFDDTDGTRFQRYGFGVDQRLPWRLNAGFEFTWRDLEIPKFFTGEPPATERIAQKETAHRAYVFLTPTDRTTVSAQYFYEEFEREPLRLLDNGTPLSAVLHRAPLSLGYYHPQGFFARLTATYVNQNAAVRDDSVASGESEASDRFWLTDLSLGYRLPKRFGLVTFGIKNLFDEDIQFQELSPNVIGDIEGELVPPLFVPERVLFGQLTLAF